MEFKTFFLDKDYLENKYHNIKEPFDPFDRMNYHGRDYDLSTGKTDEEIKKGLSLLPRDNMTHAEYKAKAFEFILDNAVIDVSEHDYFVGFYNWGKLMKEFTADVWLAEAEADMGKEIWDFINKNKECSNVDMWLDYDHTVPDYKALYSLGFSGILERARKFKKEGKKEYFYNAIEIEYEAILRLLKRYKLLAEKKNHSKSARIVQCLDNLIEGTPKTTFDVLQLIYIYFILSECVDLYQVRSLGSGLDFDLQPYIENDLKNNTFTPDEICEFIAYFLMQFSAIGNYWGHPFYLGGTNKDGTSRVCDATYMILDVYEKINIYNPKIQIKYSETAPAKYTERILDLIRNGRSSFVFVCEDNILKTFEARNMPYEDYYDFDIKGCFEYSARGKEVSSAPLYINLACCNNIDFPDDTPDFEKYFEIYADYLKKLIDSFVKIINRYETYLEYVNPSAMFSATIYESVRDGVDAYYMGSKYRSTVLLAVGIASAVDALAAVKYLVYEKRCVTLPELKKALDNNWAGYEDLQTMAKKCPYKYGNNEPVADGLTERIADIVRDAQKYSNSRGGKIKVEIHSARHFIRMGEKLGATADGRNCGDELSKNASPSPGMDKSGATSLILSALKMKPYTFHEGFCLDIMLHPSAVQGEDGLRAMKALLEVYDKGGGEAIQFNVFDTETLRDAQKHPEKYENLQVRVCGWNVLFNNMSKKEQEAYIIRCENIR